MHNKKSNFFDTVFSTLIIFETKTLFRHAISIAGCTTWYVKGQVKFCQGKYIIWRTFPAVNLEKNPIWLPDYTTVMSN